MKPYLHKFALIIPDRLFIKLKYRKSLGKWPNLNHPVTFNEKINWLKLHTKGASFTDLVDKYKVKDIVGEVIGFEHIIPTLGVWDRAEDIDFNSLPDNFVLKCTHDSGGIVICKSKASFDTRAAIKTLAKDLKHNYIAVTREYPYKKVKPRIIAEEYKEDENGELKDYKIFCFTGKPKLLFVASDRQSIDEPTKFDFYDTSWNHLPVMNGHPNSKNGVEKPKNFDEMLDIAEKLASKIQTPQVRIDLYNINGKIYFGEITFFHNSGFVAFEPEEWDYKFGSLIKLPTDK